ncbi:MAG: hypothetical protein U1E26_07545 [Coriobacteriia bacterium]|nr:hypothetical protein [Coriobacteriia bacterium]
MEIADDRYLGVDHYRSLGLMANPFCAGQWGEPSWIPSEVEAEAHRLLSVLLEAKAQGDARPLWVTEPDVIDDELFMGAISKLEFMLANDPDLNALHAYVPLPAMRIGSVRAILSVVSERIVFREFDETLAAYFRGVLGEADTGLASYKVLGPEGLARFVSEFETDATAAMRAVFGDEVLERQDEHADDLDERQIDVERLGDDEDEAGELDDTLGVAPGVDSEDDEDSEAAESPASHEQMVLDYLIEHTSVHLSPVIARALRAFHERGQVAAAAELRVTKAPRKTLASAVKLARARFDDVTILLAEFEYWEDVPESLRHKIVGALSELRWSLGSDARIVFFARRSQAPELEETFGSANRLEWEFKSFLNPLRFEEAGLDAELVDSWLAAATAPDHEPLTVGGTALASAAEQSAQDFDRFVRVARVAVECAAERGASTIEDADIAAGFESVSASEAEEE